MRPHNGNQAYWTEGHRLAFQFEVRLNPGDSDSATEPADQPRHRRSNCLTFITITSRAGLVIRERNVSLLT